MTARPAREEVDVASRVFNIGVIGFGTIGTGVVKILQKESGILEERSGVKIALTKVADIAPQKKEGVDFDAFHMVSDAKEIIDDERIDAVVEVIGGVEPAKGFIEGALALGMTVAGATSFAEAVAAATPKKGGTFRLGLTDPATTDALDPCDVPSRGRAPCPSPAGWEATGPPCWR